MKQDMFDIMGRDFPVLSDLMAEICANAGSHGRDRIKVTLGAFIKESDRDRLAEAIADVDRALLKLPLSHEQFEDFLNYVLKSDAEVTDLLQLLRRGLAEGLAAKSA